MGRFQRIALLLWLLILSVRAAPAPKYAAFVIDSGPNGKYTRQLLSGFYDRGIRATFLLTGYRTEEFPDILDALLADGHEVGCRGFTGENMTAMSRRAIAEELIAFEDLLPQGYPLRLFCPPGGSSDGVRQVAEARKLVILSWSAEGNGEVRDGDLILLRDNSASGVRQTLTLADRLLEEGFEIVTVSELANLRNVSLKPGRTYDCFPPATVAENPIS